MKLLTVIFYSLCMVPISSAQSLLAVEAFHGKLLMAAGQQKVAVTYMGGLTRDSAQGGLFSEEHGKWCLHRKAGMTLNVSLVGPDVENSYKVRIGDETLHLRFSYTHRFGDVDDEFLEKVIGVKPAMFWILVEKEEPPWQDVKNAIEALEKE